MSVMFKTQQGRTLYREDLTVRDITNAVGSIIEVVGRESNLFAGGPGVEIHASTRHIVEWWDPETIPGWLELIEAGRPLTGDQVADGARSFLERG